MSEDLNMSFTRFICQLCERPLKLSQSEKTQDLNTHTDPAHLLLTSALEKSEAQEQGFIYLEHKDMKDLQVGDSNFTLVGKFDSKRSLHSIMENTRGFAHIFSGEERMDYPLCVNCTDQLLEQLDTSLAIATSDNENYRRCLESQEVVDKDEQKTLEKELKELEVEEARLVQHFLEMEKERERAAAELEATQAEIKKLEQQEMRYHAERSHLKYQELELLDELESVKNQLRHAQRQLFQLERTNIFNVTFDIYSEGPMAVINNFRLGCLPTVPVDWSEINAAWGQTVLLLSSLSKTIGLEFKRYQLVPRGDHSYLRSLTDDDVVLRLFRRGHNMSLDFTFDKAMVAFLDCMQQFKKEAEKGEFGLCLPYRIHAERGLIEDSGIVRKFYSIRTFRNTKEDWTRALKLMLTNFKWTLSWVTGRYNQK